MVISLASAKPKLERRGIFTSYGPAKAGGVDEHVGRRHFSTKGLRTLSCGKAEKSRSADQSSLTP